ncbi:MAG: polysaccharide deacetylase family protein [Blastocatellia bacterium]
MKFRSLLFTFAACLLVAAIVVTGKTERRATPQTSPREIVITFDDLIGAPQTSDLKLIQTINRKLIQTITAHKIPAIGFVNEGKLFVNGGKEVAARTAILKSWVDAGLELGNHTYSHADFFNTPPARFEADLIRGEAVTRRLLEARGKRLRYFRHPFLNTGPNLETRTAFEKFLVTRGYTVAPVTVDNQDYVFAAVYASALARNDRAMMERVAEAYVPYMEAMLELFEKHSVSLLGREMKQTLLLHDNALNADHFDKLVQMMKRRGYKFISLEDALRDRAYNLPDTYTGRSGMSWLQRWAITQQHKPTMELFKLERDVPDFVRRSFNQR